MEQAVSLTATTPDGALFDAEQAAGTTGRLFDLGPEPAPIPAPTPAVEAAPIPPCPVCGGDHGGACRHGEALTLDA